MDNTEKMRKAHNDAFELFERAFNEAAVDYINEGGENIDEVRIVVTVQIGGGDDEDDEDDNEESEG